LADPPTAFKKFPFFTSKLVACESGQGKQADPKSIKSSLTITRAHIIRTQPQEKRYDIRDTYQHVVKMATNYIYIENQYFRWPPMAEWIKQAAQVQTNAGRNPARHKSLYLFVVTNSSDEGLGKGTQKTYEMLDSLGRADILPGVARQNRIDDLDTQINQTKESIRNADRTLAFYEDKKKGPDRRKAAPNSYTDAKKDAAGNEQRKEELKQLEERRDLLKEDTSGEKTILPEERPGLKAHICTLTSPNTPEGREWNEIYIHTKLMMINDTYMTLGSANINSRSMEGDSELNISHYKAKITQTARRDLWAQHTGGKGAQDNMKEAFKAWAKIIDENKDNKTFKLKPKASICGFLRTDPTISNLD
jgi:phosphatidylserine/phosphatidylglycerophosphate/cardiolipin synthase-like enzyme